ncbi:MAG: DMT family transporter [Clostridia bacterium]|nr:DMT family transporter [Clostridia bacterium]MCI2013698.1 DMT family transporter [Clostridia bacterium]
MGKEQNRTRGIILTFIGGVSFGFSGTCVQYLLSTKGINPVWLTTIRMFFAGIILMIIAFIRQEKIVCEIIKDKKDLAMLLLFGTAGIMSCQYTYIVAISYSNAGTATVLEYLGLVLIMIFVCLKSSKLPSINEVFAIILALTGTFLLATHGNVHSLAISKSALF